MCLDCGFGTCVGNTTVCVCNAPYSQSEEMFTFTDFECLAADFRTCLPCVTHVDVIDTLYVVSLVLNSLVLLGMIGTFRSLIMFRRYIFVLSSVSSTIAACVLRVVDNTRYFGVDPLFSGLYAYSFVWMLSSLLLFPDRFLRYVERSLRIYEAKDRVRQWIMAMIYTNWGVVVVLHGIGLIPIIAALLDNREKQELIAPSFLAVSVILFYALGLNLLAYRTLIQDLEMIAEGPINQEYGTALTRLRMQRAGVILVFTPIALLYAVNFFVTPVYENAKFWLPAINILTAGTFLGCVLIAKRFESRVLSLRNKGKLTKTGSMVDGAVTSLITNNSSVEESV